MCLIKLSLTETGGRQHPSRHVRWNAVWEDRLQYVAGEGKRDDGQRGRIHDEDGAPQQEESGREKELQWQTQIQKLSITQQDTKTRGKALAVDFTGEYKKDHVQCECS